MAVCRSHVVLLVGSLFVGRVAALCRFSSTPATGDYFDAGLTTYVEVFGLRMYVSSDLDDDYVQYAANVLAGYIDNDADGEIDDECMLAAADQVYCSRFYVATAEFDRGADGDGGLRASDPTLRDSFCAIARYEASSPEDFQYNVREELHHGLAKYWDTADPSVTAIDGDPEVAAANYANGDTSELVNALYAAHGDCERACACGANQDCTHYSCDYTQNSCSWISGSCSGVYHYAEIGCDGSCWTHEGFWHGFATTAGIYNNAYKRSQMANEWGVFAADEMVGNADAAELFTLLTNQAASQATLGYSFPTRNPRGNGEGYTGTPTGAFVGMCTHTDDDASAVIDDGATERRG